MEPTILIFVHNASLLDGNNVWYLDSSATSLMCQRKEVFIELQEQTCRLVNLRNDSKLTVAKEGKVAIYQKNGTMTFISYVELQEHTCTKDYFPPKVR